MQMSDEEKERLQLCTVTAGQPGGNVGTRDNRSQPF